MTTTLILDAGAFIHKQQFPVETELLTTSGILTEVRDPKSKLHTQMLPQNLETKIPTTSSISAVRDFAKKTGDLGFLSGNDIGIVALAVEIAKLKNFPLRTSPVTTAAETAIQAKSTQFNWNGDDEDGWVDSSNFHKLKDQAAAAAGAEGDEKPVLALVTGDYSVQNVCLQMGIPVESYEGMRIKKTKTWGLLCVACWGLTRDTQKAFCPSCGIDALRRVSITTDEEGKVSMAGGRPKRPQLKGTIFSIPKPRGGRGEKPIFAEDEIFLGGRDRQLKKEQRNFERMLEERLTLGEGETFDSRGLAPKLVAGYGRKNPNAGNFKWPTKRK